MTTPEDIFKNSFDGYGQEPPQHIWKGISRRLAWRDFLRFNPARPNVYYLAAIAAGLSYVCATQWPGDSSQQNPQDEAGMGYQEPLQEAADGELMAESAPKKHKQATQDMDPARETEYPADTIHLHHYRMGEQPQKKETAAETGNASPVDFSCGFAADIRKGCAPLRVRLRNLSRNSDYCQWSLGNGETSYETHPEVVYAEPGTYILTLKSIHGTHAQTAHDTIVVLPKPGGEVACATHTLTATMVARYSNANTYKWDFGDGRHASGQKAAHIYDHAGSYKAIMVASNGMCSDTACIEISVRNPEFSIYFPNALTYGNYFVPKGNTAEISRYSLKIYTRSGRELFASQDPLYGWDGTYNGARLPKGVYVFKAQYEFGNGEKNTTSGSITLLGTEY